MKCYAGEPKRIFSILLMLPIIACGGGGSSPNLTKKLGSSEPTSIGVLRAQEFSRLSQEARELSPTPNLPSGGSVSYDGFASLKLDSRSLSDGSEFILNGPSTINVNFSTNEVSGWAEDFYGTRTDGGANLTRYDGTLSLANGNIISSSVVAGELAGTLNSADNSLNIQASTIGTIRGTDNQKVYMISDTDASSFKVNELAADGEVILVGEKQRTPP